MGTTIGTTIAQMNRSLSFESKKFDSVVALFQEGDVVRAKREVADVYRQGLRLQTAGAARIKELERKTDACRKEIKYATIEQERIQKKSFNLEKEAGNIRITMAQINRQLQTLIHSIFDLQQGVEAGGRMLRGVRFIRGGGYASVLGALVIASPPAGLTVAVAYGLVDLFGLRPVDNRIVQEIARLRSEKQANEASLSRNRCALQNNQSSYSALQCRLNECNQRSSISHVKISNLKMDIYYAAMALSACKEMDLKLNTAMERTADIFDICDGASASGNTDIMSSRGTIAALYSWGSAWGDIAQMVNENVSYFTSQVWEYCQSFMSLSPPTRRPPVPIVEGPGNQRYTSTGEAPRGDDLRNKVALIVIMLMFFFILHKLLIVDLVIYLLHLFFHLVYLLCYYCLYCPFYYICCALSNLVSFLLTLMPFALVLGPLAYLNANSQRR